MVPSTRLIFWTASVVLPFSVLALVSQPLLITSLVAIGLFFLLVCGDAIGARQRLRPFTVVLPKLVRLQKDREGSIDIQVHNGGSQGELLRMAIGCPESIQPAEEEQYVRLPTGAPESRLAWRCTPRRRGQYTVSEVYLEAQSSLGFWARRTIRKVHCELRVYPNMENERRHLAALFLRRGAMGVHAQRVAGSGREFEKLRDYTPGDSLSDIHWKASARRNALVAKSYQVERTHEVYVLVDTSRLSARRLPQGDGEDEAATFMERYVSGALVLALAAEQQGDRFGLVTFSDRVHSFIRARSGPGHIDTCRDELYSLQPRDVSPDFEELFTLLRLQVRKRALLIILTGLDDPVLAESFTKAVALSARQHLIFADLLLPAEIGPLFEESALPEKLDEIYEKLGGHLQWQKLRELQATLRQRGVRMVFMNPDDLAAGMLAQHAEARARQLV